ncbi:P-loop containing nucleoside triphosphate hydrolase protein [Lentinula lateritia]|uniref:P-loop containing nucleoside triphosphate hydrolase protein n=1 Tax=Lentinula lateritia TaxID=40482 RepID=A0ABQ8UVS6_9AGAR|nr:P-loop containing nucleoside triphosphate hydrolase protein [Lentinula lateritia]
MPSHTVASALIKLYFHEGSPWKWPTWQDRTGIKYGLFPAEDELLPKGWTRDTADAIHSYFKAYDALDSEDRKIKFARGTKGATAHPGRKLWADWVNQSWRKWDIHHAITQGLHKSSVHPITVLLNEGSINATWPNADFYVSCALDNVGFALFGTEAFPTEAFVLPIDLRRPVTIFIQHSWDIIRRHVARDRIRLPKLEEAALNSFEALNKGKPTKAKITTTIRTVAKWKEIADVYGTVENTTKAVELLDRLNEIMSAMGAQVAPRKEGSKARLPKGQEKSYKELATAGDLRDLTDIYQQYFQPPEDDDDRRPLIDQTVHLSFNFRDVQQGDLGMEVESDMSPEMLATSLGFLRQALPHQFNTLRAMNGITPWDKATQFETEADNHQNLLPLSLHWHQLAGIHSIARSVFTKTAVPDHCTGVLVADEVGLGKTAQSLSFIAFLNQAIMIQKHKQPSKLPPILKTFKFLKGREQIEPLPHLIITPGTLRSQWCNEIQTLFRPRSIDIFFYDCPKTGNAAFWSPTGAFYSSKQEPQNRIILTTHSSLQNDYSRISRQSLERGVLTSRPWQLPEQTHDGSGTLFHQKFLTVTIDEAHEMRNVGFKYFAGMRALQLGTVKLVLTATPLLTSPKDLSSLARLIGIPHFMTKDSAEEAKEDAAAIRKAKKADDDGLTLQQVQIRAVRRIQTQFLGHVLRRTIDSQNWSGERLLALPPFKTIVGVLTLSDREMEILVQRQQDAQANASTGNEAGKFTTRKFYMEYRLTLCFPKTDPGSPNPDIKSKDEWNRIKSTKMDVCAQICHYYLLRDDVPDVEFLDGKPVFPKLKPLKGSSKTRKILIYSEFPSMTSLLVKVLRIYGVECLTIDGNDSFDKRANVVAAFQHEGGPRVLIFSSVGTVGLNLSVADVVIFFDQPWSAQDERQIRGRAHRQPQSKVVTVIHLLANDSSDIIIYNISRGKEHLFDAFLNRQLVQDLTDSLSGKLIIVDELEDSAIVAEEVEGSKTRKQAKGSKGKAKHAPQVKQNKPRKARGTNEDMAMNEGNLEVVEQRVSQNTNNNGEADPDDNPIYSEGNRNRVGNTEEDEEIHSSSAQVDDTDVSVAQSFIDETDSGWNSRVETDDADGDGLRDATSEAENASNPPEAEDNLEYPHEYENFFAAAVPTDSPGYDLPASNRKKSKTRKRVTPQAVGAASSSVEENLPTTAVSPVPSRNYSNRTTLLGEIAARTSSIPSTPPLKRKKGESHSDLDGIEISEVSPVLSKRHRRADTESPSRIPTKEKGKFIDLNALNSRDPQSHLGSKPNVQAVPLPRPSKIELRIPN